MKPVGVPAGVSGSLLAGLRSRCINKNTKKKAQVDSIYFHSLSFKKPSKPRASGNVVNLSAGLLSAEMLHDTDIGHDKSWGSKMKSEKSSVSEVSDVENLKNTVTEEMSYIDSNTFKTNDIMDDATPRKMQMRTYVLGQLPKVSFFVNVNDDDDELVLLAPKFVGSNWLLFAGSCVLEKRSFEPVKLFTLDVKLSAMPGKTNSDKLVAIKKIVYRINGFGGASTPSKFPGIIRASFTSEFSMKKAKELAICEKIIVNNDLKKDATNWALAESLSKDSVRVVLALNDKKLWMARDHHQTLLYTLPVGTTAYNLSVVCFADKASKLAAIGSVSVYKNVNLHWAGLSLAHCAKCKHFGHIFEKKQAPVAYPVFFDRKTWAQIASGSPSYEFSLVLFGAGSTLSVKPLVVTSDSFDNSDLTDCMASLECSMELLSDQVFEILRKLSFVELVPIFSSSCIFPPVVASPMNSALNSDMAMDSMVVPSPSLYSSPLIENATLNLSLSSSKVLTTKMGGLKSKMMALEAVNKSSFVILGNDFNENGSHKCASFKKCFDLGLVNSLAGSVFAKIPIWCNFYGIAKMIDYVFISLNLVNVMVGYNVAGVVDYFDTDYVAVSVSLLLLCKQTNKDYWKYDIKGADKRKWCEFRNVIAAHAAMFSSMFKMAKRSLDLDAMWNIVCGVMGSSTDETFKRKWFKSYNSVFTKVSSKFHKLELLVFRLVKAFRLVSSDDFVLLLGIWDRLDSGGTAEPDLVKSEVDKIMEGWTRKHRVVSDISGNWTYQYQPLNYVFDGAFSGVMDLIGSDELFAVVSNLSNDKAAGLFGISNEL
ncbi:hypothetical protein G9A89_018600 [Geosiphon pyriformis]|nr:hypothetical protein G9A89_018600 [Geosiphon pyriformis]